MQHPGFALMYASASPEGKDRDEDHTDDDEKKLPPIDSVFLFDFNDVAHDVLQCVVYAQKPAL